MNANIRFKDQDGFVIVGLLEAFLNGKAIIVYWHNVTKFKVNFLRQSLAYVDHVAITFKKTEAKMVVNRA